MVDPLSLTTASTDVALTAFKLVRAIATFKGKVAGIDHSVEQLQFQVDGLGSVLSTLASEMKQPVFQSLHKSRTAGLIEHLPRTISGC
jgi:hypothetical protein